ncbi:MAG TPA: response regulator [Polyangiaceae bacterium]|nr:response regulator [Polyangiaceae bacterium]
MTRILVVEDSSTQAMELKYLLESAGFDVEIASDGTSGFERCKQLGVDAVLSDVVMPGKDGYELCKAIKSDSATASLPVMLLTSLSDPMDIIRGLRCGADNFLTKPYDGAYLVGRVRRLLESRALRSEHKVAEGVDVLLMGKHFTINSEKEQILDLLLATFEEVLRSRQREFEARLNAQSLRESQSVLQSVLDALARQIAIVDQRGRIERVNSSFRQFALENGWDQKRKLEGESYWETWLSLTLAGEQARKVQDGLEAVRVGRLPSFALEYSTPLRGVMRFFSFSVARVPDQDGHLLAVEHEDITTRKQLERRSHHVQKMDAIGQLAGGVAHDFNNLLTVIRSYSDLLMQDLAPGGQQRSDMEQILKATDSASALTKQLLAFGRQQMVKPEVLDLNVVIEELDKMLRRLLGAGIEYSAVLEHDAARVEADAGQIQQILMNLVINARDAMPHGGRLRIETKGVVLDDACVSSHDGVAPGRYVVIQVTDTGTGMSADVQARVFEPFFTTKEVGKGTGLGLATVYGIVRQCRGHITVFSELDRGTTFKIFLPCVDQALQQPEMSAPEPVSANEAVLIVEDNVAVRSVLCRVLKDAGYLVLDACDAAQASAICETYSKRIHLLLTDVVMPGVSGPELAAELTQKRPGMKVLFMSGYSATGVSGAPMREGVPFLQKPFSPGSVTRAVRTALSS